jgi:hypothetical protein
VQVFNSSWATVFNQTYSNSPGAVTVPSLSTGTYHVKVNLLTSSWTSICEKTQDAVVTSISSANGTSATATEVNNNGLITSPATINVSPNPFTNSIQLSIGWTKNENATLMIIDVQGRVVLKKPVNLRNGSNTIILDAHQYLPGNYYLKVLSSERSETIKLIKQ